MTKTLLLFYQREKTHFSLFIMYRLGAELVNVTANNRQKHTYTLWTAEDVVRMSIDKLQADLLCPSFK